MKTSTSVLSPGPSTADHVRGALDAPVVITEYGDFECPYCGDAYRILEKILSTYGDRVALVFREFPLPMHQHALAAAEAAEAAATVGKFWEMHDQLYEHQQALTKRDLRLYGDAVGAGSVVTEAIERQTYRERIEDDVRSGEASDVGGTPALFINGETFDDELSVASVSAAIDRILAAHTAGS